MTVKLHAPGLTTRRPGETRQPGKPEAGALRAVTRQDTRQPARQTGNTMFDLANLTLMIPLAVPKLRYVILLTPFLSDHYTILYYTRLDYTRLYYSRPCPKAPGAARG